MRTSYLCKGKQTVKGDTWPFCVGRHARNNGKGRRESSPSLTVTENPEDEIRALPTDEVAEDVALADEDPLLGEMEDDE
eukprot:4390867-Amphidinium_carterae.2